MNTTEHKTCTNCAASIHPLEEFPGCICLDCHAAKFDQMNPEQQYQQMIDAFSGGAINFTKGSAHRG